MNSIPRTLRLRIENAAKQRCGYCLTQAAAIGMPLELDHLIPLARGGTSTEENLWLACPQCNPIQTTPFLHNFFTLSR